MNLNTTLVGWVAGLGCLASMGWAAGTAAPVPLRLELNPIGSCLVVGPLTNTGTIYLFGAADLDGLKGAPGLLLLTNTPLAPEVRVPLPAGSGPQAFYRAAQWTGLVPPMIEIPAGTFLMGPAAGEPEQAAWEGPPTAVTLTRSFSIGKREVTQAEYQAVMGSNPSYFSGVTNRPVEQVNWTNATDYCLRLTQAQRQAGCLPSGWEYRLPTEAEWEYACRAGTPTAFSYGDSLRSGMANFNGRLEYDAAVGTVANASGVMVGKTVVTAGYAPNAWGLYDMHGNVWEWCLDRWSNNLPGGSVTNPQGADSGTDRVIRGGCWYNDGRVCRSAYRSRGQPGYRGNDTGFRIVLAPVAAP